MARKYLTPIDLTGLELTNFKIQNLSSNPNAYGKGHTYYNTSANELRTYNGTSWETVGGNVISGATADRPAAGHAGRLYFDTTLSVLFFDNGTAWVQDGVTQQDLSDAISNSALGSTDELSEGINNLYFTDNRARTAVVGALGSGATYLEDTGSGYVDLKLSTLETQLITDGFAKTEDIPSLSGYVTESGTQTLSNKTISDNLHFNDGTAAGYIRGNGGNLDLQSYSKMHINADGELSLYTSVGDIILNPDGSAYLYGNGTPDNLIATQGWVNTNSANYITSVNSGLSVTSGALSLDYPTIESALVSDGIVDTSTTQTLSNKTLDNPEITIGGETVTGITSVTGGRLVAFDSGNDARLNINGTQFSVVNIGDTVRISGTGETALDDDWTVLTKNSMMGNVYVVLVLSGNPHGVSGTTPFDPVNYVASLVTGGGSLTVSSTELSYLDGVSSNIQDQLDGKLSSANQFISSIGNNFAVDSSGKLNIGSNIYVPSNLEVGVDADTETYYNGVFRVKNDGGTDAFRVDASITTSYVRSYLNVTSGDAYETIKLDGNQEKITFNSNYYDQFVGSIGTDGTGFDIAGGNSGMQIRTAGGDIYLNPDGQVVIQNGTNLVAGNNVYVKNGIYAGGSDTETDGIIRVQDYSGNNVFTVTADGNNNGGAATVEVKGEFNVYRPGPFGNRVGQFSGDGDDNLVINATQNNLILQSDSNNSVYLGSVSADNKVVKQSDLTALSSGLSWKVAANLLYDDASPVFTGDLVMSPLTIDGHSFASAQIGYRVLVKNSSNAGIYEYSESAGAWTLTRTADADVYTELVGAAIFIMEGDNYGATSWVQSNHYINDFTGQSWVQFSGQGTYTAGNGIQIDGQSISVKLDEGVAPAGLNNGSNGLSVKLDEYGLIGYSLASGGLQVNYGTGLTRSGNDLVINTSVVATKYSQDITYTVGTPTSFDIDHNLGTKHVQVTVFEIATGEEVVVDVTRSTNNRVVLDFAVSPASDAYTVVVVG